DRRNIGASFDQLVCAREQRGRHGETERLGDPDVNDQLKLCRLLEGEVGGLGPLQDLVHEGGSAPEDEAVRPNEQPKAKFIQTLTASIPADAVPTIATIAQRMRQPPELSHLC